MRWYIESDNAIDKELKEISKDEKNEKILEILRHRSNGSKCCESCPTRNNESHVVLDWKDFYDKKPIYMSVENIVK